jgi:hypothetical protein
MTLTTVDRPHAGWWMAILGGIGLTAALACSPAAYALWVRHVAPVPSRPVAQVILAGTVLAHLGEALYASRVVRRAGLSGGGGWILQTLVIGFPSLRLLLRRARGR